MSRFTRYADTLQEAEKELLKEGYHIQKPPHPEGAFASYRKVKGEKETIALVSRIPGNEKGEWKTEKETLETTETE